MGIYTSKVEVETNCPRILHWVVMSKGSGVPLSSRNIHPQSDITLWQQLNANGSCDLE